MKKTINSVDGRKFVIAAIFTITVLIFIIKLFFLQVVSDEYKSSADSNAFFKKTLYPARGRIYDRKGELLVFNQPTYDIIFVPNDVQAFDTLDFCNTINISLEQYYSRMNDIRDLKKNPGYSTYTLQTFITRLGVKESSLLQEKLYKFPGFLIQNRTMRQYVYPNAGQLFGYVAETDKDQLEKDKYYRRGDYAGKTGIEVAYEKVLRGSKGQEILLRDARGRLQGKYEEGKLDEVPVSGKDLTLSIDMDLQIYAEYLLQNKVGSVIMIEPSTGEILCLATAPTYDPSMLLGREFGNNYTKIENNPLNPLFNRSIQGRYPPGSVFKPTQGAVYLQENIITSNTVFPCAHGYIPLGGKPKCHPHASPTNIVAALGTSCNAFFCHGLHDMLQHSKYKNINQAFDIWESYMKKMGFGQSLGIDLQSESGGQLPTSKYYSEIHKTPNWKAHNIISIAIGQGEIITTPLQLANFAAVVANRGHYYAPHVVKSIEEGQDIDEKYRIKHETGINAEHWESIAEGMRRSVTNGTSRRLDNLLPDKQIAACGKTGTAENPHGDDHSLFIAFAPMDNPKVAIAVVVENGVWGARYGAPIARLMFQKYFNDGKIPLTDQWTERSMVDAVVLPPEAYKMKREIYYLDK